MDILIQIFAFLVTIVVLVSIHEAGHMFVARFFKIKVLKYSIGFGKALWRRQSKKTGTEYVIAVLPLGGYVKLLDECEGPVEEAEKHRAFNRQSLFARVAVVAAGPLTNIILAILIYWLMFSVGIDLVKPVIGKVSQQSLASTAGIQAGDKIIAVDGQRVEDWQDIMLSLIKRMGESGQILLQTQGPEGQVSSHSIPISKWKPDPLNPDPLHSLGIEPYRPPQPAIVDKVKKGSPAAKAGVRVGDQFVAIDGVPLKDWYDLVKIVQPHPGKLFHFEINRGGEKIQLAMTPDSKMYLRGLRRLGVIGVTVKPTEVPKEMKFERQYNPLFAIGPASAEVWRFFDFNFIVIKKLFKGEISLRTLNGPITIFNFADRAFKAGFLIFLNFLALISVMLAFVNVLPIPGLDGGRLLNYLIEFIIRRPISASIELFTLRLGFLFLLLLTLVVTYNDILRLLQ
jgi:regulator of sigma E protease